MLIACGNGIDDIPVPEFFVIMAISSYKTMSRDSFVPSLLLTVLKCIIFVGIVGFDYESGVS